MSASSQLTRLLALVPYLLGRPDAPVTEVAETFGVTPAQLRKDLTVLTWCGLPGLNYGDYIEIDLDAVEGQGTINLTNADYMSRPLQFTADEAVALLLALRTLREVADPEQEAVIDSAASKLEAAAGERAAAAERTEVRISGGDARIRTAVHRALREQRRLQLTYDVAARAETTHRQVDPLRASARDGYVYLDAWCHTAGGLRSFRMDRIAEATVLDVAVAPHPDIQLPSAERDWFAADADEVTAFLAPEADWVTEYYPGFTEPPVVERSRTIPPFERSREVRFPVGDPAWLRALLLRLGGAMRVVEPAEAEHPAHAEAVDALEQYRALGLLGDSPRVSG